MSTQKSSAQASLHAVLQDVEQDFAASFERAQTEHALREAKAKYLGPSGQLTQALKFIKDLSVEEKKTAGQTSNALKKTIEAAFQARLLEIHKSIRLAELSNGRIDVTLPGRGIPCGHSHPITRVMFQLLDIFRSMGFETVFGPEIESHENNFDKLGFPPDHPATDMQDSFYIEAPSARGVQLLMRTHTSNVQVRQMQHRRPPLAVVSPGAVYRRDDDATHSPKFFQLEGFALDKDIHFGHLKGTLTAFIQRIYGPDTPVRFRPSYFPFVEPGGEVDIGWKMRDGSMRWLEILGCGMVHPVVLENVGYHPDEVQGFAFGLGLDRMAMLAYDITDIRWMYENDIRFLTGF